MTSAVAERPTPPAWAPFLLVLGGLTMSVLWLVFTASHGPTGVGWMIAGASAWAAARRP